MYRQALRQPMGDEIESSSEYLLATCSKVQLYNYLELIEEGNEIAFLDKSSILWSQFRTSDFPERKGYSHLNIIRNILVEFITLCSIIQ